MRDTPATIERIRRINADYQHLELIVEDDALRRIKPGQSLLARLVPSHQTVDQWDPYLREHWWPVGLLPSNNLLIERPTTSTYTPGQVVSILGPVGNPYRYRPSLRNVLLIAYDTGPTPLTIMIPALLKSNISVALVLLGAARAYDTQHLPAEIEVVRGEDDFSWDGQVMTLGWADQAFVVVGHDDEIMRFGEVFELVRQRRNDIPKNYLFGVFQPPMPCGLGACMACMVRTQEGLQAVCTRGPALDLTQIILR